VAESEIKTTRLRYVAANSPDVLTLLLDRLPCKVEIKGAPVFDGNRWLVWFVIPDILPEFKNFVFEGT
jgi:hypothetical protein